MDFFKRLTGQSQTGGPPLTHHDDDDDVYPVHALDDTKTFRSILVTWTLSFNDVLDADALRASLSTLLDTGDWRKLGGRLRLNAHGALEIHVPRAFSAARPAFAFSHREEPCAMQDHAVAGRFPQPQGRGVSVWPGPQEFGSLAARADAPATLQDLLTGDTPQMAVHVTSFTNGTFVALSWPHTLMDVMGQQALMNAWSLVLAGRAAEVPRVLGAREDVLRALVEDPAQPAEEYALKGKQLAGLAMAKFGALFAWEMLTGPVPETKTICLSTQAMARLRAQATQHLPGADAQKPFVSDGDVLTAWAIRAVATTLPRPRPITALHAMNARFRLPSLLNAPGVYLQNMLVPGFTFFPADTATGPLGPIALSNRQHLIQQATEPQVLASLREQRLTGDPSTLLYSDADAVLLPFTDWTKARFFTTVDFAPAVVGARDSAHAGCSNASGTPVAHHASSRRPNPTARRVVVILGKDQGGNYWLTMTLSPLAWGSIEESLEELGRVE